MQGTLGISPLPRTLKKPYSSTIVYYLIKKKLTALVTSITAAFFSVEALRASSDTRVHSLSRLMLGQYVFSWFEWTWKFLIPT